MTMINRRQALSAIAFSLVGAASAQEAAWPTRPITLVVPYPPGGQMDAITRTLARALETALGQTVIVDNRAGATTLIATYSVARGVPDGYTFLVNTSALISNPIVLPNVTYDAFRDFAPVARFYDWTVAWVVPGRSARTLQEFIAMAKASPRPLTYASPGHGSASHFYAEMFAKAAGIQLTHVPYKGDAAVLPDLREARVDAAFVSTGFAAEQGRDGQIRALAVSGSRRSRVFPDIPTFKELGIEGLSAESFTALFASARVPRSVLERMHDAVGKVAASAEFRRKLLEAYAEPVEPLSLPELSDLMRKSRQEWVDIKSRTGIVVG
jgi:tripartite-type tricarboxylate transporter receptor subunit TctC